MRGGGAGQVPPLAGPGPLQGGPPGPWVHRGAPHLQPGRDPERGGGVAVRLGDWATILDAEVWAADPAEPVAKMPIHIK